MKANINRAKRGQLAEERRQGGIAMIIKPLTVNGAVASITAAIENTRALYSVNGMFFPCEIIDARKVWGRVDVLIRPVGGRGEKWVEKSSITMIE